MIHKKNPIDIVDLVTHVRSSFTWVFIVVLYDVYVVDMSSFSSAKLNDEFIAEDSRSTTAILR